MHSRSVLSAAPSADRISDRLDDGSAETSRSVSPCSRVSWRRAEESIVLAGEQRDHVVRVRVGRAQVGDHPALAQHHDAVGEPEHLVDVVAGEQDRGALLAQAHDQLFDLGRFLDAQRRRWARPGPAAAAGRPMARATATSWRWPPDSQRTLRVVSFSGMRARPAAPRRPRGSGCRTA